MAALKQLKTDSDLPLRAVIFGADKASMELAIPYTALGRLNDDVTLALAYSAADVMVVPSTQEAFGKTAIEAMACGTPVVSFDTTGLQDIVEHRINGYRAECFSAKDLAHGILWTIEDESRQDQLSHQSRHRIKTHFSFEVQAKQYINLYQKLIERSQ